MTTPTDNLQARIATLSSLLAESLPFVEASDSYSRQRGAIGETPESDVIARIKRALGTDSAATPVETGEED